MKEEATLSVEEDPPPKSKACCSKARLLIGIAVVVVLVAIITPIVYFSVKNSSAETPTPAPPTDERPPPQEAAQRLECHPESADGSETPSKEECERRNCLWYPNGGDGRPRCFFPAQSQGFTVTQEEDTPLGQRMRLDWRGRAPHGGEFPQVQLHVEMRHDDVLRFKFDVPGTTRFEVPISLTLPDTKASDPKYEFVVTDKMTFNFQVKRKATGKVLLDTSLGGLILSDQFLQFVTRLPSANLYGLGENDHLSFRHQPGHTWPLWSRDQPPGWGDHLNLYGVHPFYTCLEDQQGHAHGVLLLNSNAQDYSVGSEPSLTFRTTGGVLDFYVFLGPSPEQVVQQYTQMVGRPFLPPYWSLGFQLCRYGYNHIDKLKEAVDRTRLKNIPHDVQYADIDHMEEQKDFTVDNVNFAGLNDYFQQLRAGGMHTIIILDPCLLAEDNSYAPYTRMRDVKAFITWPEGMEAPADSVGQDRAMLGYVWPNGKVVFPDFFKNATQRVWKELIVEHHSRLVFDGLWIDMNEPANFGTNEEMPWNWPPGKAPWSLKCPQSKWDDPPYRTKAAYKHDGSNRGRLSDKTVCLAAVQGETGQYRHYDVHSLYGWSQTPSTLEAAQQATGGRSIVISRSTFPGSGQHSGHWLGDNDSEWPDLHESIIGMLEFNLFGIPYIGADIGGFWGNATGEMVARWMQLGAFYPFSRNHNGEKNIPQDPGAFDDEVAALSREAIETRYWLLPYLYTLFYHAHTRGGTVVRPVHHEFATDNRTYGIDQQFMWGPALLISPILQQNQSVLTYFLPDARWYDFYNHQETEGPRPVNQSVTLRSKPALHVRGGYVIPLQQPANNTHYSRTKPFALLVALDRQQSAQGELFWDDGVSKDTVERGEYFMARYSVSQNTLRVTVEKNDLDEVATHKLHYNIIQVLGVKDRVTGVVMEGGQRVNFTYVDQVLTLRSDTAFPLNSSFTLHWGSFSEVDLNRVDCMPDKKGNDVTQDECSTRGCQYSVSGHPNIPSCFFPTSGVGYRVMSQEVMSATTMHLSLTKVGPGPFGEDFQNVTFHVEVKGDVIHFQFFPTGVERYRVPMILDLSGGQAKNLTDYFQVTNNETFSFRIVRPSTQTVLWDTGLGLVLSQRFLQVATRLPGQGHVYGFGENDHPSFRHQTWYHSYPLFSRDQPEDEWPNSNNRYGVHPFYTCVEDQVGNSHGVLLLNSNAQDYTFSPLPSLTYRTTGGVLDFYLFLGPSPEQVVQQYTQAVGRPFLPSYWSLGFHLSRYGYNHVDNLREAITRTRQAGIPQDGQMLDIDHLEESKIFTVDNQRFPGLASYVRDLRTQGIHTFLLLDPCLISNETGYAPYDRVTSVRGSIMWPALDYTPPPASSDATGALLGYVWPKGKVIFVDFFKNESCRVWRELITDYHKQFPFDGILIDMNEPASFGTNEERPFNWPEKDIPYWSLKCPQSRWDDPPYRTGAASNQDSGDHRGRLSDKTVCLAAVQGETGQYHHYDVHSLYGWSQTLPTLQALQQATGERGLLISRSTFVGSGRYTGHWLGDNRSRWKDLKQSVIGILEFSLFGIPFIGSDICGFFEDTTPELCKRWMQLGAFYTFSRSHNGLGYKPQDPGAFDADTVAVMRVAMETRYWLLPYLYTLFYHAHTQGSTVIRPLHHEFPTDTHALFEDEQFLWGPALLISPILREKQQWLSAYLPQGRWYNFYTGETVTSEGRFTRIISITSHSNIPLHVRGGHVIPMQQPANNTQFSKGKPLKLLVALDKNDTAGGMATGTLFWDDGVSLDPVENGKYFLANFSAEKMSLTMRILHNTLAEVNDLKFHTVEVWGVTSEVNSVRLQGSGRDLVFSHDTDRQVLNITADLSLGQPFTIVWSAAKDEHFRRIDCIPEAAGGSVVANQAECQRRGCLWDASPLPQGVPPCYFQPHLGGYSLDGDRTESTQGFTQRLQSQGGTTLDSHWGNFQPTLTLAVQELDNHLLRISLYPQGQEERLRPPVPLSLPQSRATEPRYDVTISSQGPFSFSVTRRSTGTVIWDTEVGGLQFREQFLQLSARLGSASVFGFGENLHPRFQHDLWFQSWPMWSRDQWTVSQGHSNHYGVHPFYVAMESDGQAHGVLFFNSHAQDYSFTPLPMLTYRSIGGMLDFLFFLGPDPEQVIQQYTAVVGRPYLPPYWALGFQLCKYGYNHLDNVQAAVNRTRDAGIPHDVQYVDIDHMDERKDFTIDRNNFAGLPEYFRSLQSQGMKTIIILDPCFISNETGYAPYDRLTNISGAIMWGRDIENGTNYTDGSGAVLGYVWPKGKVVFPDFFKNETRNLWEQLIVEHHRELPFDGLWIDMNEPANFGTNEERPFNWPEKDIPYWSLQCPQSSWDDPPYRTGAAFHWDKDKTGGTLTRLSEKTVCLSAQQGNGGQYRHYDVHSLYGWSQTLPTLQGVRQATGKRSMVISRSTFVGSGQHAGHWLGDNGSEWPNMVESIIGLLEFNLFGIPYIGADICGFFGDPSPELCKRWMQLGAFYTFSRNHAHEDSKPQDPGALGEDVATASRVAMETRYWLLPYLYTLFYHAHTRGSTVIRPLHHEFPGDRNTYSIDRQFLWGPSLLISPILEEGQTSLSFYLPGARWYDFYTGGIVTEKGGNFQHMAVGPDSRIPLHLRAGVVLPLQRPANNTFYSRKNNFRLVVALEEVDHRGSRAEGELFWDDGDSIDTVESESYFWAFYEARDGKLEVHVQRNNSVASLTSVYVDEVEVWGVKDWVNHVAVNGERHTWFRYYKDTQKLVIQGLTLPMLEEAVIEWSDKVKHTMEEAERIDCLPDSGHADSQVECHRRGCIWEPASNSLGTPWCHMDRTRHGYQELWRNGNETRLQWRGQSQVFQGDITHVSFVVEEINDKLLHFKLVDPANPDRYQVPVPLFPHHNTSGPRQYIVTQTNHSQWGFYFRVARRSSNTTLWDTSIGGLTFAEQFLQLTTRLPSKRVYGFGENRHFGLQHDFNFRRWPMFSRDQPPGSGDYGNLYGVHPFYVCVEEDGNAHAVLLLNSNAMEVVLQPAPALTYRTVGGVLDFYMFLGPSMEDVVMQYTELVGRPYLPPYWSLGFQLCKYGYNNLDTLKAAVNRTLFYDIPLDVQYADIDHMEERKDFTIDQSNFAGLGQYVQELDSQGVQFIIILDPALDSEAVSYRPYLLGLENRTYIRWPEGMSPDFHTHNNSDMLGYVWPRGKVVFPDFFKDAARDLWADLIVEHHKEINFDGLWIDMNEPANFDTNLEKPFNWPHKEPWSLHCPVNKWDDPPYKPSGVYGPRLSDKTLCMVGLQLDGRYRHYDVHSLYGWSQTLPTLQGLQRATGKRGMVISRSTYVGSGRHTGHWLGDNASQWSHLHDSIIGIIEFNLFGIPYIGADICGYFANADEEMCERWMELGSFYTFSRNHNGLEYRLQDPGVWGRRVASSSRRALRVRYSLLPHLYSLFYVAHTTGATVIRSLIAEFPRDPRCAALDTQFLWGSGFMVAPVLEPGKQRLTVYFPDARWFDFYTGEEVKVRRARTWVEAPRDTIPLYVRGGHVIPTQDPANNTRHSRQNPMGLLVAPDDSQTASGKLFWDDGDSIDTVEQGMYFLADFTYTADNLTMTISRSHTSVTSLHLDHVTVFGVTSMPSSIRTSGSSVTSDGWRYDATRMVLRLRNLNIPLTSNFEISWN